LGGSLGGSVFFSLFSFVLTFDQNPSSSLRHVVSLRNVVFWGSVPPHVAMSGSPGFFFWFLRFHPGTFFLNSFPTPPDFFFLGDRSSFVQGFFLTMFLSHRLFHLLPICVLVFSLGLQKQFLIRFLYLSSHPPVLVFSSSIAC